MPSSNTYHLTWVSRTFDMGYLFTAAPAKELLLLTLDEGYLLTAAPPDLEHGVGLLGPPAPPAHPPLLGHGFAPPGQCPWPLVGDSSSGPPPLTSAMRQLL